MAKIRVIRVLEIIGDVEWVDKVEQQNAIDDSGPKFQLAEGRSIRQIAYRREEVSSGT